MPPRFTVHSYHQADYAAWDDTALAAGLTAGDERAFAEVYERYWWPLLQLAVRGLGTQEAGEEVVQELFVQLWQKRGQHQIQHLKSYLNAAVQHRVLDVLKAQQPRQRYANHLRLRSDADHSTEQTVATADLTKALHEGLEQLPPSTREVFRLSRFEHQSVPEIAERMQVSRKAVEYHLTRALKHLRSRLRDFLPLLLLLLGRY